MDPRKDVARLPDILRTSDEDDMCSFRLTLYWRHGGENKENTPGPVEPVHVGDRLVHTLGRNIKVCQALPIQVATSY